MVFQSEAQRIAVKSMIFEKLSTSSITITALTAVESTAETTPPAPKRPRLIGYFRLWKIQKQKKNQVV